jgi:hypothetical protein
MPRDAVQRWGIFSVGRSRVVIALDSMLATMVASKNTVDAEAVGEAIVDMDAA